MGIRREVLDVHISYMAGIIFFDVLYAIVNVVGRALGEHFDRAVRQVADETGKLVTVGHSVSGKAKSDALDPPDEFYVPGNHFLMDYLLFLGNNRLNNDGMLIDTICSYKRTILPACSNK